MTNPLQPLPRSFANAADLNNLINNPESRKEKIEKILAGSSPLTNKLTDILNLAHSEELTVDEIDLIIKFGNFSSSAYQEEPLLHVMTQMFIDEQDPEKIKIIWQNRERVIAYAKNKYPELLKKKRGQDGKLYRDLESERLHFIKSTEFDDAAMKELLPKILYLRDNQGNTFLHLIAEYFSCDTSSQTKNNATKKLLQFDKIIKNHWSKEIINNFYCIKNKLGLTFANMQSKILSESLERFFSLKLSKENVINLLKNNIGFKVITTDTKTGQRRYVAGDRITHLLVRSLLATTIEDILLNKLHNLVLISEYLCNHQNLKEYVNRRNCEEDTFQDVFEDLIIKKIRSLCSIHAWPPSFKLIASILDYKITNSHLLPTLKISRDQLKSDASCLSILLIQESLNKNSPLIQKRMETLRNEINKNSVPRIGTLQMFSLVEPVDSPVWPLHFAHEAESTAIDRILKFVPISLIGRELTSSETVILIKAALYRSAQHNDHVPTRNCPIRKGDLLLDVLYRMIENTPDKESIKTLRKNYSAILTTLEKLDKIQEKDHFRSLLYVDIKPTPSIPVEGIINPPLFSSSYFNSPISQKIGFILKTIPNLLNIRTLDPNEIELLIIEALDKCWPWSDDFVTLNRKNYQIEKGDHLLGVLKQIYVNTEDKRILKHLIENYNALVTRLETLRKLPGQGKYAALLQDNPNKGKEKQVSEPVPEVPAPVTNQTHFDSQNNSIESIFPPNYHELSVSDKTKFILVKLPEILNQQLFEPDVIDQVISNALSVSADDDQFDFDLLPHELYKKSDMLSDIIERKIKNDSDKDIFNLVLNYAAIVTKLKDYIAHVSDSTRYEKLLHGQSYNDRNVAPITDQTHVETDHAPQVDENTDNPNASPNLTDFEENNLEEMETDHAPQVGENADHPNASPIIDQEEMEIDAAPQINNETDDENTDNEEGIEGISAEGSSTKRKRLPNGSFAPDSLNAYTTQRVKEAIADGAEMIEEYLKDFEAARKWDSTHGPVIQREVAETRQVNRPFLVKESQALLLQEFSKDYQANLNHPQPPNTIFYREPSEEGPSRKRQKRGPSAAEQIKQGIELEAERLLVASGLGISTEENGKTTSKKPTKRLGTSSDPFNPPRSHDEGHFHSRQEEADIARTRAMEKRIKRMKEDRRFRKKVEKVKATFREERYTLKKVDQELANKVALSKEEVQALSEYRNEIDPMIKQKEIELLICDYMDIIENRNYSRKKIKELIEQNETNEVYQEALKKVLERKNKLIKKAGVIPKD